MLNPNFLKLQKLLNKKNKAIIVLVKRTIFFRVYTGFAFAIYFFLLFLSIFGNITFHEIWFSTFLVCLGTIFFVRFLCYNIDSNLFLGTWLCFSGAVGILNYVFVFNVITLIGLYVACFGISSLTIFLKFRQIFHFKVFVFVLLCVILLVTFGENLITLVPFIVLSSITGTVILALTIVSIKANTRKV